MVDILVRGGSGECQFSENRLKSLKTLLISQVFHFSAKIAMCAVPPLSPPDVVKKSYEHFPKSIPILSEGLQGGAPRFKKPIFRENNGL